MANNPYAPPKTRVEDVPESFPQGGFLPGGRMVPVGNGWQWIADAWALTRGQRLVFIGVMLLLMVVQVGLNFVPFIGPIATTFLFPFLVAGFVIGCDVVRRGGQLEVDHVFAGFRRHTNKLLFLGAILFAMSIVIGLVMILILGPTLGMAFLGGAVPTPEQINETLLPLLLAMLIVLALSVPMTMAVLFVPMLVVLNDAEVMPAVRTSFVACLKNAVPFLIWGLAGLVLFVVSAPVILVGPLLVTFLLGVSMYTAYRDIFYDAQGG